MMKRLVIILTIVLTLTVFGEVIEDAIEIAPDTNLFVSDTVDPSPLMRPMEPSDANALNIGETGGNVNVLANMRLGTGTPAQSFDISRGHSDTRARLYYDGGAMSDRVSSLSLWASEPGITYHGSGIGHNIDGSYRGGSYRLETGYGASYIRFLRDEMRFGIISAGGTDAVPLIITSSGNVGIGTTGPGQKLDVSGAIRSDNQLISTVATGTAPLAVSSQTVVSNLNADLLDGLHASSFERRYQGSFSVPSAGWYRVAYVGGSSGRGNMEVSVYTTGGSYAPRTTTIRFFHDWGSTAGLSVLSEVGGGYWNQARVTGDGTNSYLEVYFTGAVDGGLVLQYEGGNDRGTLYSGSLPAGGSTVRVTTDLGLLNVGTGKFFVSDAGNVGIGTTNPEAKLHVAGGMFSTDGLNHPLKSKAELQNNTTLRSGIYQNSGDGLYNSNGTATVLNGWWHVVNMHHQHNNGYNAQIAVPLSPGGGENFMFFRTSAGGTWSAWRKLTDTAWTDGYTPGSQTFNYTGGSQTFTVPTGVTSITVDARGGRGSTNGAGVAGRGGRIQGTLSVTSGEVLYIYVGGQATSNSSPGYNGGAAGSTTYSINGAGGGASDIRRGGTALSNRILVAGGGGGAGYNWSSSPCDDGGAGGGTTGGRNTPCAYQCTGYGGTQSAGGAGGSYSGFTSGSAGSLGNGGAGGSGTGGGGGGGGYYGGGGGCWGGGGGGSSYPATGFTHTQGYQNGNGQVIISW